MIRNSRIPGDIQVKIVDDATIRQTSARALRFYAGGRAFLDIDAKTEALAQTLNRLSGQGTSLRDLMLSAAEVSGNTAVDRLVLWLDLLGENLLVEFIWRVADEDSRVVVSPRSRGFHFSSLEHAADDEFILSRFAYVRRSDDKMILESPEALCRIELLGRLTLGWVSFLRAPVTLGRLHSLHEQLPEFAEILWCTGFLEAKSRPESSARASWEFHDRLFHWRTRSGRLAAPQGETCRFLGKFPSPPGMKLAMTKDAIDLSGPGAGWKIVGRGNLVDVLERRRTSRQQGERPITIGEVAAILYHAARIRQEIAGDYQELYLRSVPAAGAIHELEFYLVVGQCQGLRRGLYHYHAHHQKLFRLPTQDAHVTALLRDAAVSWGKPDEPPQVLIILASRLPRLAWKYEGIAYRLTLLNAGVVLQTVYLLATELGLACSALGGGDIDLFATATDLDPLQETSVAELAIGSPDCRGM
jgi:SagB-type dehydrogenase family enzyme